MSSFGRGLLLLTGSLFLPLKIGPLLKEGEKNLMRYFDTVG